MKKGVVVLLILVAILFIAIVVITVFNMISKDFKISFLAFGYKENLLFEKTYDLNSIENIEVLASCSNVKFMQGSSDKIKVSVYGIEDERVIDSLDNGMLQIQKENTTVYFISLFFWNKDEIIVELPNNYCHEICITTSSGNIEVANFPDISAQLKTTAGNITCGDMKSGVLYSTSGNIRMQNANEITANSSAGNIVAGNLPKANLSTTSGKVVVEELLEGNIHSTAGNIKIGKANFVTAQSTSGNIHFDEISDFCDLTSKSGSVKIGSFSASKSSHIQTTSGSVKIENCSDIYVDATNKTGSVKIQHNNQESDITLKIETTAGSIRVD